MKRLFIKILFAMPLVLGALALAEGVDPSMVESKVQVDLDNLLSRMLPKDEYVLQVNAETTSVQEKKLLEGESVSMNRVDAPKPKKPIIMMPGFVPKVENESETGQQGQTQSRQTYTTVEKNILKGVAVTLTLDENVDDSNAKGAQDLVRRYLDANYPQKGRISFSRLKMMKLPSGSKTLASLTESSGLPTWLVPVVSTLVVLFVLGMLLWAFAKLRKGKNSIPSYQAPVESVLNAGDYRELDSRYGRLGEQPLQALPGGDSWQNGRRQSLPAPHSGYLPQVMSNANSGGSLKNEKGNNENTLPPLPASPGFVERRAELLDLFFSKNEVFRIYFSKLNENAKLELYAGLRGPAFDSFLESSNIEIPTGGELTAPPSEEQLHFYIKNFEEFTKANEWQKNQFFGFLHPLTTDQIVALIQNENALIGAIVVKFIKSQQAGPVLDRLDSARRAEIVGQFSRIREMHTTELAAVENTIRAQVAALPQFTGEPEREDLEFWSRLLSQSTKPEEILSGIESARPDLYQALARFRFKLEDAPSIPEPLINRVLDSSDNDELTKALLGCSKTITEFFLSKLEPARRDLVSSQLAAFSGISQIEVNKATLSVTKRFRELLV